MKSTHGASRAIACAFILAGGLAHGDPPPPTSLKCERLADDPQKVRVTVSAPPAGATGIYYRWWGATGTKGVFGKLPTMDPVFVVSEVRPWAGYTFEVKFRNKDGYSDGITAAVAPAPFQLLRSIDRKDLERRGWAVKRVRRQPAPLLIDPIPHFKSEGEMHTLVAYNLDGTALVDQKGGILQAPVEIKLVNGRPETTTPLDRIIDELLQRVRDKTEPPVDPGRLILILIPPKTTVIRREHLHSGIPANIYFPDRQFIVGLQVRF